MSHISTHVLDTARGTPAAGVKVTLEQLRDGDWVEVGVAATDANGRIGNLVPAGTEIAAGEYQLRFATGDYFSGLGEVVFYPFVSVRVRIDAAQTKHHLPLLLSPFGYSTYRGT